MKIAAYDVQLAASQQYTSTTQYSAQLSTTTVRNSTAEPSRSSHATDARSTEDQIDPHILLLQLILERLTGHKLNLLHMSDLSGPAYSAPATNTPQYSSSTTLSVHASVSTSEQTNFAASGSVRTTDGQQIDFQMGFSLSRSESYSVDLSLTQGTGTPAAKDPLMINFSGTAAQLSDQRFSFDLDADGQQDSVALPGSGSGFIAFDRNGNGTIDNGSELFGTRSGNGFADLAQFDDDGNGWIDENDAIYASLSVWQPDSQGNGSLTSLKDADVGALYLASVASPFTIQGSDGQTLGLVRASGVYLKDSGGVGALNQVDLVV